MQNIRKQYPGPLFGLLLCISGSKSIPPPPKGFKSGMPYDGNGFIGPHGSG